MVFPACCSAIWRRSSADVAVVALVLPTPSSIRCLYRKLDLPRRFLVEESEGGVSEGPFLVSVSVVDDMMASENNDVEKNIGSDRA